MFQKAQVEPLIFFWKDRKIKIDKINLVHTSKEGNTTLHHFSVSSEGNYYRLQFNNITLKWILEQVEEGYY